MNIKHTCAYLGLCSCAIVLLSGQGSAQVSSSRATTSDQHIPTARDGQHDFNFELGTWTIHLKRLMHPLTGSSSWVYFDGTSITRKLWNGRAEIEEFETDSPAAGHIEGLTLRTYNSKTHQWSLYCVFRSMPATSSGACRAMIPVDVGPAFRSMPAGGCDAG